MNADVNGQMRTLAKLLLTNAALIGSGTVVNLSVSHKLRSLYKRLVAIRLRTLVSPLGVVTPRVTYQVALPHQFLAELALDSLFLFLIVFEKITRLTGHYILGRSAGLLLIATSGVLVALVDHGTTVFDHNISLALRRRILP